MDECRCVDRDGNEIENCTCIVRPDREALVRVWSSALPNRARIGVTVSAEQDATADREGARIQEVLEGGPADDAGLREGDLIVRVDGRSLFEPLEDEEGEDRLELDRSVPVQRLLILLGDLEPGENVEIEYLRDGETRRAVVEAERNPARLQRFTFPGGEGRVVRFEPSSEGRMLEFHGPEGRAFFRADSLRTGMGFFGVDSLHSHMDSLRTLEGQRYRELVMGRMDPCFVSESGAPGSGFRFGGDCVDGLELTPLGPELGEYFGTDEGLLVTDVRDGATLGLEPGDVLLAVDGRAVEDVDHARRILRSYQPDEELTLRIVRRGETMEVTGHRR